MPQPTLTLRSAGITDSALTTHGVLQAERLGAHLASTGLKTARIYSSDLQRAFKTADAIRTAQGFRETVIQLPILREQDFGFYEGKRFYERPKDSRKSGKDAHLAAHRDEPGFVDVESKDSMTRRATDFVNQHLVELMETLEGDLAVVVVAHGIILNHLWRAVLRRFRSSKISVAPGVAGNDRGLEYLGGWSNTGLLDLEVKAGAAVTPTEVTKPPILVPPVPPEIVSIPISHATKIPTNAVVVPPPVVDQSISLVKAEPTSPAEILDRILVIKAVNDLTHLNGLKKTRGGIGSLKHDSSQTTMDSFFKKRKLA
jgi:broad specificity phosphatase PhoE